jgi:hypothetical protein
VLDVLRKVPEEVRSKYYGCGSPFPTGMSGQPLRVLDLGCGSGRDCYVCAALVGKDGHVTGGWQTRGNMQKRRQSLPYHESEIRRPVTRSFAAAGLQLLVRRFPQEAAEELGAVVASTRGPGCLNEAEVFVA